MDLEPIEERANEFATWVGKFDSTQRIPTAFASASDVPALIAEVERLRAQRDEWFLMESGAREAAEAEVILLRTRIRKARHQRDEARAEVARLAARPAPAWDEDAATLAVFERSHEPSFEDSEEGMREAREFVRTLLVRDHLPVKPSRETVIEAMSAALHVTTDRIPGLNPGPVYTKEFTI